MNLSQHWRTVTANSTVLNTQRVGGGLLLLYSVAWVKHPKKKRQGAPCKDILYLIAGMLIECWMERILRGSNKERQKQVSIQWSDTRRSPHCLINKASWQFIVSALWTVICFLRWEGDAKVIYFLSHSWAKCIRIIMKANKTGLPSLHTGKAMKLCLPGSTCRQGSGKRC